MRKKNDMIRDGYEVLKRSDDGDRQEEINRIFMGKRREF